MRLSRFGEKFSGHTGIMDLMDDMGRALAGSEKKYMLGGGNPASIPAMEAVWRRRLQDLLVDERGIEQMLGRYDTPQGQPSFLAALADMFQSEYQWSVGPENIAITNGSQTAFFMLLNMFSGPERILFPLLPEYIGYADQGIDPDTLVAVKPRIERLDEHTHKYHVDFEAVERVLAESGRDGRAGIGAICVSRPTNPSGNVLTDDEVARLDQLARRYNVPLLIDNAYGMPFPHIIFDDVVEGGAQPMWNENTVLGMSLSKIGLPGTRTGIIVASEEIITALSRANAVISLANATVGQYIVEPMVRDRSIISLSRDTILPFYRKRAYNAQCHVADSFGDDVPYSIHRLEGSIFLWLWMPDLPVPTVQLYERLKKRDVLVVPGEYFFFGNEEIAQWRHKGECIRINYGQEPEDVKRGIEIIAHEVKNIWRHRAG